MTFNVYIKWCDVRTCNVYIKWWHVMYTLNDLMYTWNDVHTL